MNERRLADAASSAVASCMTLAASVTASMPIAFARAMEAACTSASDGGGGPGVPFSSASNALNVTSINSLN